ncbi:glycoside hydrolase family 9 protein [Auraticoccus monumenti]|uniref:Endoglucanase n=1 Tax=Auraticoccus monumenti TaxID=675864 RepID=A0A1G6UZB4_9ACTN|nr:glycoside hydrolase family 9 protein [Auraticoccus monumenti]SDD45976.1 Carbohydrate binding domain-containing protein [Auraticoccus monumenti]
MVSPRHRLHRTAAALVGGLLVTTTLLAPAAASPLDIPHDFSAGPDGWFSYGPGATTEVTDGELCTSLPAHSGNPWDVAVAHNAVGLEAGTTYDVAFTASSTAEIAIRAQVGINAEPYPGVHAEDLTITATPEEHSFSFSFTSDVDAEAAETGGQLSFQIGNQGEPFTFCLDDFSLTEAGATEEQLPALDVPPFFTTGNLTPSTTVEEGVLCTTVPAGTTNTYDAIVGVNGIPVQEGGSYTLSFLASADVASDITVVVGENGGDYRQAFSQAVALDSAEPTRYSYEFTSDLAFPASTGDGAPEGQVAFQLGGGAEAFELCLSEPSLALEVAAGGNLVPNGDFGSGALDPFTAPEGVAVDLSSGAACLTVPDTLGQYDGLVLNGLAVEEGQTYTLTFDASADPGKTVRALIGENGGSYGTVLDEDVALTAETTGHELTFVASAGYPAATVDPGDGPFEGQLAFQVGGRGAFDFCIDDISLVESDTPPPPYEPETGPRIRVNQVGYLPDGPKQATLVTDATEPLEYEVLADGIVVHTGQTVPAGLDETAGTDVHELDFSDYRPDVVDADAVHEIAVDGEVSFEFAVRDDLYQQLRADALNYFYPARSGIAIDGGIMDGQPDAGEYTRDAGHVEDPDSSLVADSPNRGDVDVRCLSPETEGDYWKYGDWSCDYTLDVVGGWYDAGDHGKYVVNGGISVGQVLSTYERTLYSPTGTGSALGDGSLNIPESDNGVPDPLDEARWELEWMLSMQAPDGAQHAGMVHHKIADVDWTGLPLLPSEDPQERYLHRPSTAATLNLAAVAAQGARLWAPYDQAFADELLAAARVAWDAAVATPDLFEPAPNADPSPGSGPYDDDEVGDEFYWAAAELFLTTGEEAFEEHVLGSPFHTADIWSPSGFSWGSTAALGRMDLATVESDLPGRDDVRASVVEGADRYLGWQQAQPFGTAYPGNEGVYEWGSNSAVLNNQVVIATAFDLTSDQVYADAVLEAMDYLLGRNALNNSYITGYGDVFSDDQHSRWFAHSIDPDLPNPPRGSVAGGPNSDVGTWDPVISGLYDEERMCAPQRCYLDDIQSWSTNEITVNWNSALSWVASFVADQQAGDESGAGQVVDVVDHPEDMTVEEGEDAVFTASASGDPVPDVQWQRLVDGVWTDVDGAEEETFTFEAALEDDGALVRAYFSNGFGGFFTDPATLSVTDAEPRPTPGPSDEPDDGTPDDGGAPDDGASPGAGGLPEDGGTPSEPGAGGGPTQNLSDTGPSDLVLPALLTAVLLLAVGSVVVARGRRQQDELG